MKARNMADIPCLEKEDMNENYFHKEADIARTRYEVEKEENELLKATVTKSSSKQAVGADYGSHQA